MPRSLELARTQLGELPRNPYAQQKELQRSWPGMGERLRAAPAAGTCARERDAFLSEWEKVEPGSSYPAAIAGMSAEARSAGTAWLQGIVDSYAGLWQDV
jgi:hypothetical protein